MMRMWRSEVKALDNKQYDVLDSILEDIHMKCIRIEEFEKKALHSRFTKVIDTFLITMMKMDPTFAEVFHRTGYTGSYFEGVRVSEATEFDLNLILKLNLDLDIDKSSSHPGFVGLKVKGSVTQKPLQKWIVNGLLDPNRVKQWLESVVARALADLDYEIDDCRLNFYKGGPAMTLTVSSCDYPEKDISIDLVPVIAFSSNKWPHNCPRKPKKLLFWTYDEPWFVVPKGIYTWRVSFPIQESKIIKANYYLKFTLRLLKKLRDELKMHCIASYYIKTLFLWEIEKNKDHSIWLRNTGRLFFHMLVKLRDALANESLPFYWNADYNLLSNLRSNTVINYCGRLNRFIAELDTLASSGDKMALYTYMSEHLVPSLAVENAAEEDSWCTIL